jgi:hypothetical protein
MSTTTDDNARELAITRLRRKRGFQAQLVSYLVINAFLWGIWYFTKGDGNSGVWPAWVTVGWGIGLAFSAWHAYGVKPITEDDVQREMERTKGAVADDRG